MLRIMTERHGYREIFELLLSALIQYRGKALKILFISFISTCAKLFGLLAFIPVLKIAASGGQYVTETGSWLPNIETQLSNYLLFVIIGSILLFASVIGQHYANRQAYETASHYLTVCAERTIKMVSNVFRATSKPNKTLTATLQRAIPMAPNACAILFLNTILAANNFAMILVLLLALITIAPTFAFTTLILMVPFIFLFIRNIRNNTQLVINRSINQTGLSAEKRALQKLITDNSIDEVALSKKIQQHVTQGQLRHALQNGLEFKRRARTASLSIDQIEPFAILVFGILVIYAEQFSLDLVALFIGFLLLRQCLASLSSLASSFSVINRIYPGLREYLDLQIITQGSTN